MISTIKQTIIGHITYIPVFIKAGGVGTFGPRIWLNTSSYPLLGSSSGTITRSRGVTCSQSVTGFAYYADVLPW